MYEDGPNYVLQSAREKLGVEYDYLGRANNFTGIGTIFSCFWCFSVWSTIITYVCPKFIRATLAISSLVIAVEEVYGIINSNKNTITTR